MEKEEKTKSFVAAVSSAFTSPYLTVMYQVKCECPSSVLKVPGESWLQT